MDDDKNPQDTVVPFRDGVQGDLVEPHPIDQVPDPGNQQPFDFDESYSVADDADTQDLMRAIEEGEFHAPDDHEFVDQHDQEIPDTAAEMTEDIRSMVEDMAGESPSENDPLDSEYFVDENKEVDEEVDDEDKEDLQQESDQNQQATTEELPDLEIKPDSTEDNKQETTAATGEDDKNTAENTKSEVEASESKQESQADQDKKTDEEKDQHDNQAQVPNTDYGYPQPQPGMVQTSALGAIGHAFGSVINGVFGGIGMALGAGMTAVKQTKDALNVDNGTTISNKAELGAHFHFNPAQRAMENSFSAEKLDEWRQARVENEFTNLQTDMDAHLRSVDRLKQTEWAQKLTAIEKSGDPEQLAKAPAILNMAKAKTDFKDADRDMSYFQGHIEQRVERITGMLKESNQDPQRLENMMNQWQEQAKKRLDDLPDSKEKNGILDKIQNAAQKMMAGLKSLLGGSARASM